MARARSFRITFSKISGSFVGCSTSALLRIKSAVFSFSLWQVAQYLFTTARYCSPGVCAAGVVCAGAGGAAWGLASEELVDCGRAEGKIANPMTATPKKILLNIALNPFLHMN